MYRLTPGRKRLFFLALSARSCLVSESVWWNTGISEGFAASEQETTGRQCSTDTWRILEIWRKVRLTLDKGTNYLVHLSNKGDLSCQWHTDKSTGFCNGESYWQLLYDDQAVDISLSFIVPFIYSWESNIFREPILVEQHNWIFFLLALLFLLTALIDLDWRTIQEGHQVPLSTSVFSGFHCLHFVHL